MTDSQLIKTIGQKRAQRGVSLIEVLVVLVLLVTGILVIIRLYPSGFFSIQSTGNAALADGLGTAAIGTQAQDADSLPEAILPGTLDALGLPSSTSANAAYDPDNPNNLDNARVISNETITVPALSTVSLTAGGSARESIYAVKYGPLALPNDPAATLVTPSNLSINSPYWTPIVGNYTLPGTETADSQNLPQAILFPGQERLLVDLANQKIAVPYAVSYDQKMVVVITGTDNKTYYQYLKIPQATPKSATYPNAPLDNTGIADVPKYILDTATNYQGGWFDPTDTTALGYGDTTQTQAHSALPSGVYWASVTLYRPYQAILTAAPPAFSADPYQFMLIDGNIGGTYPGANPGAIQFNPLAAGGTGTSARKVNISYLTDSWSILREDHDIPVLSGTSTTVIRTTVQNLEQAGAANPDNSINPGIANSGKSLFILDLDTGQAVGSNNTPDPTDPDAPIMDEDTNGPSTDPTKITVSFATGRFTFGSQVFGATPSAHRIRIFYQSSLNWTVAVQKAPSYFNLNPVAAVTDTTPLLATEYALNTGTAYVYFARCNAGKTVELDGTYTDSGGVSRTFTDAISIAPTLNTVGASNVSVYLMDPNNLAQPVPPSATNIALTTVRGLSARAVVAWKERNQWKVHSVDTVLNRTP